VAKGLGLSLATFLIIVSPFIFYGTVPKLITGLASELGVMPNITNNANNLWGLVMRGRPIFVPDAGILLAGFSYWGIGLLLLSIAYLVILARLKNENKKGDKVIILSAFLAFSYFMLATRVHYNHLFFVLPFISLVWFTSRKLLLIYSLLSLTFLVNLVIFDSSLINRFPGVTRYFNQIQLANSFLNITIFVYFFKEFLGKALKKIINKSLREINRFFLLLGSLFLVLFALFGLIYQAQILPLGLQFIRSIIGNWQTVGGLGYYLSVFESMYSQLLRIALLFSLFGFFVFWGRYIKIKK
jgi:hypothetical protein